eukprot:gene27397-33039_t
MDETGADYEETLAEAGRLGYAEADPTADVEGYDAAAKAAILASIAFHTRVTAADVYREGISTITSADLASAKALDCTIKLLSICERIVTPKGKERISARVYPALVPLSHPLASVNGAFNAVVVEAENAGRLMFYGQGAGGAPTASAVMGDLVMAARNKVHGGRGPRESKYAKLKVAPMGDILTRYYVNMEVADKEGVLSAVAAEFAKHGVSISVVRQEGAGAGARLVVVTHVATDAALSETVAALNELEFVTAAWPGLIEAYRDRLAIGDNWKTVTLREGGTPLLPAGHLSEITGCDVYLKVEGLNPTGSFKDRGMTMAVTDALARGQRAVLCASTGNTSASAAAYAAKAGMTCAVLIPQGKIAMGKLAQAVMHGAKIIQVQGNFDDCLELARKTTAEFPTIGLVNSVNPVRIEGQKTAAFEIMDVLGKAPDVHALPVGNAGNITAYWRGYSEYY